MSPIAKEVDELLERRPSGTCTICYHLPRMPESERLGAERGLASKISLVKMAEILTSNGYPTSASAVHRHRSKGHA